MRTILLLVIFTFVAQPVSVLGDAWGPGFRVPDYDPLWKDIKSHWRAHWNGEKYDEIDIILIKLKKKYPEKIEPLLWLSRTSYMRAFHGTFWKKKKRIAHFKKAVLYADAALKIDPSNRLAFKLLVASLPNFSDKTEIVKRYDQLIKKHAPLPTARAAGRIRGFDDWNTAIDLWDQRIDISRAEQAVALFEKAAKENPKNGRALLWAARGMYYLGYYYMAEENEDKYQNYFECGAEYGKRALKVIPRDDRAHYWYVLNFARSLQDASIVKKGFHFKSILNHMLVSSRENALYFYFGPVLVMGTSMTKGGFTAKKIMGVYGVELQDILNGLDVSEILYPDYLYIPLCRAEIYTYSGREKEAKALLKKLVVRNPDKSKYHAAENRVVIKLAKSMLKKL